MNRAVCQDTGLEEDGPADRRAVVRELKCLAERLVVERRLAVVEDEAVRAGQVRYSLMSGLFCRTGTSLKATRMATSSSPARRLLSITAGSGTTRNMTSSTWPTSLFQ